MLTCLIAALGPMGRRRGAAERIAETAGALASAGCQSRAGAPIRGGLFSADNWNNRYYIPLKGTTDG